MLGLPDDRRGPRAASRPAGRPHVDVRCAATVLGPPAVAAVLRRVPDR
jgi:hypothetical protein